MSFPTPRRPLTPPSRSSLRLVPASRRFTPRSLILTVFCTIVGLLFIHSRWSYLDDYDHTPKILQDPLSGDLALQAPLNQALADVEYDCSSGLARWSGVTDAGGALKRGERGRQHPIEELTTVGKVRWESLLERQSTTLVEAVGTYKQRYGRLPPKGFDGWWEFCTDNDVKIVDDYDQIDHDVKPYLALSPHMMRDRVDRIRNADHTYTIDLSPTHASTMYGPRAEAYRAGILFGLLEAIAQYLPCNITMTVSDHDAGTGVFGDDQRQAAMEAINEGRYLTPEDLVGFEIREGRRPVKGLVSACPEDSLGWKRGQSRSEGLEVNLPLDGNTSFIFDPRPTYDFCLSPSLLKLHGALSYDFARDPSLRPMFQLSKWARDPQFLTPPLQSYDNHTSLAASRKTMRWEEKTVDRLSWRGTSTGDSFSARAGKDWRMSHRPRLHLLAQETEGMVNVWVQKGTGWQRESWGKQMINERYMDVGLIAPLHQCNKEDGTCDQMAEEMQLRDRIGAEEASRYKYVLDIDGNGWSQRYHRLLMSGSVVFKSTIYPEWNSDWLTPWVHYVPVKVDYSDIYDIMSFFSGPPQAPDLGRENLAKQIADQARSFGEQHWRWVDMQAYLYRSLLEYARLQADDRDAWSHHG